MKITLEKRLAPSTLMLFAVPVFSIFLALLLGGVFLVINGSNPVEIYGMLFKSAFGSSYGITESIVKAIPLMLAGLGVSLAFRMQLWNIGAEGQIYMGAVAATWVALTFPGLPAPVMIPFMLFMGFLAGALWALLPAIPRAYMNVNETITTLLMNYIAILWADYLIYGPWKDPAGFNFPLTPKFVPAAILPTLGETRIHLGLIFAIGAAIVIYILIKHTKWGYEVRVIGESPAAARYAGMNIKKNICLVLFLSGGLAGIAGMAEVSGVAGRLQHGISPGYGYTAIIVAWLARLHPATLALVSFLFGGLLVGGFAIQLIGMPAATVSMLQGLILFFVLGGQVLTNYNIKIISSPKKSASKEVE
ncbi:ABC transporter permease [Dehalobacterium formicoaceticum]|uniref:ABC transporter permease n=1 Tax=Dehalobacterium formicoaceticum TaxID=51515 RepID=A0ABT1Y6Q3_9FIRM|nr:ABC transporter permease [Dehalobacterium formicoaceticum]MCR6545589.1 ABC transporter permease [Dehalobacterium formicoaceticum]